jgi:hypothetical protein
MNLPRGPAEHFGIRRLSCHTGIPEQPMRLWLAMTGHPAQIRTCLPFNGCRFDRLLAGSACRATARPASRGDTSAFPTDKKGFLSTATRDYRAIGGQAAIAGLALELESNSCSKPGRDRPLRTAPQTWSRRPVPWRDQRHC